MLSFLSCTHKSDEVNGCHNAIGSGHLPLCTFAEVSLIFIPECLMFRIHIFKVDRSPFTIAKCQSLLHIFLCLCSLFPTGCLSACGNDRLEGEGGTLGKNNVRSLKYSEKKLIYMLARSNLSE